MSTESELRDWRSGQTNAERMCAAILAIEGYTDIDPQAPLGGPDDKKDILARRAGHRFVVAVFFPHTHQNFASIKRKFAEDRRGVARHRSDGFVFMVNQPLTLGERQQLEDLGGPLDELYHLERLRHALDSPSGYGLRLEYLRRSMTVEEQIAFFSTLNPDLTERSSRKTVSGELLPAPRLQATRYIWRPSVLPVSHNLLLTTARSWEISPPPCPVSASRLCCCSTAQSP
jgi:hypothetical protein